jgi:hypothetical protein
MALNSAPKPQPPAGADAEAPPALARKKEPWPAQRFFILGAIFLAAQAALDSLYLRTLNAALGGGPSPLGPWWHTPAGLKVLNGALMLATFGMLACIVAGFSRIGKRGKKSA